MFQSKLFGKTLRDPPKDEQSINARLLVQAGYVEKLMAGVYSFLPLGLRVLNKIENIIREEINVIGGQELLLPALHPREAWEQTGRWETVDDLYKLTDSSGRDFALGATHEEIITPLAKRDISSYRDLPLALYQFQTKFRMELRAKSGLLRGREFMMKDLYSFHVNEEDFNAYYKKVADAYKKIFNRTGIGERTVFTFASGGTFSKYSHEFQTLTSAGEDTIYLCEHCGVAVNGEIIDEQKVCPECGRPKDDLKIEKAIEVGNIFPLKTKFSEPFKLTYKDEKGEDRPVLMGCYGIGLGRVTGTIVEVHHDKEGICWPSAVAPYQVHLVRLSDEPEIVKQANALYEKINKLGLDVLYDDRDASAGVKLKDADLIGLPLRLVVSDKTVKDGVYELKERMSSRARVVKDIIGEIDKYKTFINQPIGKTL
ncbi:hypothetical protein A3E96_03280 [Candidatus Uhrbacteria bacterium RIFCSPHIGHO2_12_FULL_46_13]|uniref:Proline--tRNA ligase n=1 Tax=Candidatus Uhrbacteria bacterium RIFCSPLOWO2_01_FULL_47_25 TaxID=1802402 RepID=A0A1F7UV62_9BACT|nr:MAG: hypothetical protein A2752_02395 [Candidatus Uhrbacteria bacterium RIFCSPHIGHO2_01_FULL_46_23]OGL68709.1 MAG: hypothetical protein A3D60_02000 [Candidatus Uhrbacteria bacterium RIFCSPHIGHO2_02_FULL_47_29]OGL74735.1 MAG: hypothetical protein A3E96_03280 [Candidatus Uhrbacteria bacterium RIFCSPHIGHO2_12_FULL_46_13]OGL82146.1 MAG: hypothetical protein A2936_01115 [Candidatus Uhrbacteria bacterium RIFCSPLOWO2_01_FULL_47_25]OGL85655.1 MAG: hypothetical protein A3I37_04240 [Candidatus Uhrbact